MQALERCAPGSIQHLQSYFLRGSWQAQQVCLYATKKRWPASAPGTGRFLQLAPSKETIKAVLQSDSFIFTETFEEKETWKTKLIRILKDSAGPLTSQALWLKAEVSIWASFICIIKAFIQILIKM